MYSQNVRLPNDFFKKDKKSYADWTFAFFRELIQNSKDAGSTKIDFKIYENENNPEELIIESFDNGKGMTKDILINVLLSLGGSLKDEGSIGGFGYAKIILFFSHLNYEIRTKNNLIKGSGGSYDHFYTDDYVNGTHIKITLENSYPSSFYNLPRKLQSVLDYSSFSKKINFTLNGEKLNYDNVKYDYEYNTTLGKVHFKDNADSYSSLWIRVDGLAMFEHSIWTGNKSNFLGTLDLELPSTEVLVANRDSLISKYSITLNNIFSNLSNERSSLKSQDDLFTFTLNEAEIIREIEEFIDENYSVKEEEQESKKYDYNYKPDPVPNSVREAFNNVDNFSPFKEIKNKIQELKKNSEDFISKIDNEKYPTNFQITKRNVKDITLAKMKNELNKVGIKKLSHLWQLVVNVVLSAEMRENRTLYFVNSEGFKTDYSIGIEGQFFTVQDKPVYSGYFFSNGCEIAVNMKTAEEYKILLNIFKDVKSFDIEDIIDLACHEVAHIFYPEHNEDFAAKDFELRSIRRKHYKTQEIKNKYKEIIKEVF